MTHPFVRLNRWAARPYTQTAMAMGLVVAYSLGIPAYLTLQPKAEPMTRSTDIVTALDNLDKDDPANATVTAALNKALADTAAPVFNTHSNAFAGMLIAQQRALQEKAADINAKKRELDAELTDVMLAESAIAAALAALQRGR